MNVDADEFRALRAEAAEVTALRQSLIWHQALLEESELRAEQRGYERGFRAGRAGRPASPPRREQGVGHLRLVSGGSR